MGKGLLFNELVGQRIYGGDLYTQITDIKKLLGRFNSHTVDKLFINVDKAAFGGYTSLACKLKGMVTESTVQYEAKGKDAVTIPCRLNIVFTSNDTFPVKIESDDRRYFVLATENSRANDRDFFGHLAPLMRDRSNDAAELFYRWLMSRDLTGFEPRDFPRTKARQDMQTRPGSISTSGCRTCARCRTTSLTLSRPVRRRWCPRTATEPSSCGTSVTVAAWRRRPGTSSGRS